MASRRTQRFILAVGTHDNPTSILIGFEVVPLVKCLFPKNGSMTVILTERSRITFVEIFLLQAVIAGFGVIVFLLVLLLANALIFTVQLENILEL